MLEEKLKNKVNNQFIKVVIGRKKKFTFILTFKDVNYAIFNKNYYLAQKLLRSV